MPDNTQINAPTIEGGQDIASEDVGGGINMPRGKIVVGDHGTDGGDVTVTNPFPVQISDGSTTILPAQDSTFTSGNAKVQVQDGSGHTLGISSSPLRIDPVGTTTQPISALSLPLPTGAAQDTTITARLNTLGQKASVGSAPVVIASDQSPVYVDGTAVDLNSSWSDVVAGASQVVKASAGTFYEIDAANTGNVVLYLQLFNASSLPDDGTAPNFFFPIPIGPNEKISLRAPRAFSSGLVWAASTTISTLTVADGTPLGVSVEYR